MPNTKYKLVIYVPQTHLEKVRLALAGAGAGKIGKYDKCAFLSSGIGVFRPLKGSKPSTGKVNETQRTGEARIEVTLDNKDLKKAIAAAKIVHPYEEPVIDIYKLESADQMK